MKSKYTADGLNLKDNWTEFSNGVWLMIITA